MTVWQPIETALKDGSEVLIWNGEDVIIGYWDGESFVTCCGWTHIALIEGFKEDIEIFPVPTHWMPLPAPPVEKQKCPGPGECNDPGCPAFYAHDEPTE